MTGTPTALALNGLLKPGSSGEPSSTERMLRLVLDGLKAHGVEGEGDAWPCGPATPPIWRGC